MYYMYKYLPFLHLFLQVEWRHLDPIIKLLKVMFHTQNREQHYIVCRVYNSAGKEKASFYNSSVFLGS